MALDVYRKKRKFGVTSEPRGRKGRGSGYRYVIQKHDATRLHYDLRLELDGMMKSWAVTRGPSLDPGEKRLAVHVEDHPIEYNTFEGTIPQGEYGGGTVMVWDRGHWQPEGDPHREYAKGHLTFDLDGEKLHGRWHLVRMRGRERDRHENWLLIKGKDDDARGPRDKDILEEKPLSAATGRSMDEIAGGKGKKRVWHSNRGAATKPTRSKRQSLREFKAEMQAAAFQAPARIASARKPKAAAKPSRRAAKPGARTKAAAMAVEQKVSEPSRAVRSGGRGTRLPEFVPPSLATLYDAAPSGAEWIHEIKFDGYRIEARLDHGKVRLLTRKQLDWAHRFERTVQAVAALPAETALLDGELVVENEQGVTSFSLLQTDLRDGRGDRFVYWVFDLLYLDGRDLTGEPLLERKAALRQLLKGLRRDGPIRYAEHFEEDGPVIFKSACDMGLEGIISKLRDAPYQSGRTENFIKTKCHNAQEFIVAGFTPSSAMPNAIGALTVAFHENGALRYAGRVGTGYTHKLARDLWRRLNPLRIKRPPLVVPKDERRKNVIWVRPEMVVETEYRGVTHDGLLRQAAFKGVREDKPAGDVVREAVEPAAAAAPASKAQRQPARRSATARGKAAAKSAAPRGRGNGKSDNGAGFHLTHPDRVYWSDAGVTKADLAAYYVSVWDWMAPHILGRALSLVRAPEGVGGETFFQKHIAQTIKSSPLRHTVAGKDHDVIAVETPEDMVTLVQSGTLEVHVRGSRLDSLETADRLVFDLDPGDGVTWKDIVAAAREIRERLAALKLESFVKLSGGKGVHVVLPIADVDWDTAKNFTQKIAGEIVADSPQRYVSKMTKSLRPGKIFIDYFRNSREATSVAPYSTRARPGAAVSAPLSWEQLGRSKSADEYTVLNLKKRFRADPWDGIGAVRQKLPSK